MRHTTQFLAEKKEVFVKRGGRKYEILLDITDKVLNRVNCAY